MGQSNVMAGFLALAFLIFITARGKLPAYASIFVGDAGGAAPSGTGGTAPSGTPAEEPKDAFDNAKDMITKAQTGYSFVTTLGGLVGK